MKYMFLDVSECIRYSACQTHVTCYMVSIPYLPHVSTFCTWNLTMSTHCHLPVHSSHSVPSNHQFLTANLRWFRWNKFPRGKPLHGLHRWEQLCQWRSKMAVLHCHVWNSASSDGSTPLINIKILVRFGGIQPWLGAYLILRHTQISHWVSSRYAITSVSALPISSLSPDYIPTMVGWYSLVRTQKYHQNHMSELKNLNKWRFQSFTFGVWPVRWIICSCMGVLFVCIYIYTYTCYLLIL